MHVEYLFLWRADTSIRSLPSYFLGVCDPFDYGCWMVKAGFSELLLLLLLLLQLLMILGARVLNVETFDAFLNLHFIVLLTTSHHTHTHTHTHTDGVSAVGRLTRKALSELWKWWIKKKNPQLLPLFCYLNQILRPSVQTLVCFGSQWRYAVQCEIQCADPVITYHM